MRSLTRPRRILNSRGEKEEVIVESHSSLIRDHLQSKMATKHQTRWDSLPKNMSTNYNKGKDKSVAHLV